MRRNSICALLLLALIPCMTDAVAKTFDVRLRIRQEKAEEKTITRENLIKIKQFILQGGKRETYCNMYNDNPAYQTKGYSFYLNPDSRQKNINCDPKKSDFHDLTIRKSDGGKNQYRKVEFLDEHYIYITTSWPTDDLTVLEVRQFVVDAMKEILVDVEENAPAVAQAEERRQQALTSAPVIERRGSEYVEAQDKLAALKEELRAAGIDTEEGHLTIEEFREAIATNDAKLKSIAAAAEAAAEKEETIRKQREAAAADADEKLKNIAARAAAETAARSVVTEDLAPATHSYPEIVFEKVSVVIKAPLAREMPQSIQISSDGTCLYKIEERPKRGEEEAWPPANLLHKMDTNRLLQLQKLLEETQWLKEYCSMEP